jgi:hypothetical protein
MNLDEVAEQSFEVVDSLRALRIARELYTLDGGELSVVWRRRRCGRIRLPQLRGGLR